MNKKYLEALGKNIRYKKEYIGNDTYRLYLKKNEIELLEKYLTELEAIDNAKPSEALELVGYLKDYLLNMIPYCDWLNDIEKYILKAQEQEKVLEIIKEKRVDLSYLRCCFEDNQSVERYNEYIRNKTMVYDHEEELTQEEFELLKRYLK